jgi:hypothetical protein
MLMLVYKIGRPKRLIISQTTYPAGRVISASNRRHGYRANELEGAMQFREQYLGCSDQA